jgi:hypothetical protein
MTNVAEAPSSLVRGALPSPLSVAAYHTLVEAGLIAENSELLYGFVYPKIPKITHSRRSDFAITTSAQAILPTGLLVRPEQPILASIPNLNPIFQSSAEPPKNTGPNIRIPPNL